MARKIFKRVGIRRDKNFADLSDPTEGLNNLLDTLVDSVDATFISEDLNAIRNIFATGLDSSGYRKFIGSRVEQTSVTGINNAVIPRISYQNRLDKFEVSSGDPRLNGGNGPTANYFNSDQVEDIDVAGSDIFTGISTGGAIPSDNFWEAGDFQYTAKIHPQSINAAGGVQWEGFFVPTRTGQYSFNGRSTLGFTLDFQTEGYTAGVGTYTEYARVNLSKSSTGTTTAPNIVTITPISHTENIGVGMSVTGSGIRTGTLIEGINRTTGAITLVNPDGDPVTSIVSNTSISFTRSAGTLVSSSFKTYTLEKFKRYRIRFRFYSFPGVSTIGLDKRMTFLFVPPGATSNAHLRYNNLYSLDYDFSENAKGSFNRFLDQSVLFGGNKSDGTEVIGGSTQQGYVRVGSSGKIDIKYTPKTQVNDVIRKTFTSSWSAGAKVINVSDTTDIEIGNYLFGTGLTSNANDPIRVTDIVINEFLIVDTATNATGSNVSVSVVNHRGFVKRVTAGGSGTTMSISAAATNPRTAGLKSKQIAIWNGASSYTGITTTGANNSVNYFPSQNFGAGTTVYFYESRGLIDKALNAFCVPAATRCVSVASTAASGATQLTVESVTGISNGWVIQGFPFADNTTITAINTSTKVITLSTGTTKNIAADSNFTATNSGADRQLCCPPTDTSPPFNPTEEGLETTTTSPNLEIISGNVVFDKLNATIDAAKITTYSSTDKSNNRLLIQGGDDVTYSILCV